MAALLGVSVYKLQKDPITGKGLRYVSYGRCVRYPCGLDMRRRLPAIKVEKRRDDGHVTGN